MTIRRMQIGDYDEVHALWLSCTGMGLNDLDDSRDGIRRFLERNPETCFVAEDEGKIVGVILAGSDGRRGYIYHTAVLPEFMPASRTNVESVSMSILPLFSETSRSKGSSRSRYILRCICDPLCM